MRIRNSGIPHFTVDHFNQARFSVFPGIPQQSKCSIPKQRTSTAFKINFTY